MPSTTISPARLVGFCDGIFAIAITLLVFNLRIPHLSSTSDGRLFQAIVDMVPNFVTYILSFLLIAVFWFIHHHMFNHIQRVDNVFIWLNVFYLLGVSFLPFPSSLLGAYSDETFPLIFYICSMSYVGFMLLAMWGYASHRHRLIENNLPRTTIRYYFLRGIASQLVFLLTIILTLIHLDWGKHFLFILIPVQALLQGIYRKTVAEKKS